MGRLILLSLFAGCASPPEGLRETPPGTGPTVVIDWDAEPLPEIPYPNDLATRPDPTSPTGLRLNISEVGETEGESEARQKLNELTGFGVYAPITVAFDALIDLDDLSSRHPDDFERGPAAFADDAVYLIDVTEGSPDFGKPVALDLGHGRYPMDAARGDRYFPNDPRSEHPSVVFETASEDLDGDGVLDWGEDTDNDGVLDVPNVYPVGGDPRADLLTFYERQTNTLIVRPVVPLREETRYAMVLTERLVGTDGQPVRSPWAWVNHTRQTTALTPLVDALPELGLSVDDVAFAWTFTTGRVTGDLVDIRRGLDGEGPYAVLGELYPPGIEEALQVRDTGELYALDVASIFSLLIDMDLLGEGAGAAFLQASAESFMDRIVGGAFTTPYLLADRDDGGRDDTDEWFRLDPYFGLVRQEPRRVAFTCVLPKAGPGMEPPFPVVLYGHGYGSSRFEFLAFAHAMNRTGMAACAMDFPGHGPTLSEDEALLAEGLLSLSGMGSFLPHLRDARYRDLNNDGEPDSGGDQWSADGFHTRDMVRQAVVDWMQLVRGLRACGEGEMVLTLYDDGVPERTEETRVSCDWDDDGVPDLGGPDARIALVGGSLGGIVVGVAAPVIPEISAAVPIVPGGGLLDVGVRTEISGAVEALVGRLITPMFLGYPTGDGGLRITQMVNSVTDMEEYTVATIRTLPAGGRFEVENLHTGVVREGYIPEDGRLRVSIAADALDPAEKRMLVGMPDTGPGEVVWGVPHNAGLGDALALRLYDADGALVAEIDTFEADVRHEGITMPAGSPLIALSHGLGKIRGSPDVRRLAMILAASTEPGDAIAYGPHYHREPFADLGGRPVPVFVMPTVGDTIVNVNTGIALARAAGLVPWDVVDDRYGMTVDQWLIDRGVVQGLEQYGPWRDAAGNPVLFDIDDQDEGTDGTGAPSDAPLRSTVSIEGGGVAAFRLPYANKRGSHGFGISDPDLPFDVHTFSLYQAAWFAASGEMVDDPCFATADCDFLRPFTEAR